MPSNRGLTKAQREQLTGKLTIKWFELFKEWDNAKSSKKRLDIVKLAKEMIKEVEEFAKEIEP